LSRVAVIASTIPTAGASLAVSNGAYGLERLLAPARQHHAERRAAAMGLETLHGAKQRREGWQDLYRRQTTQPSSGASCLAERPSTTLSARNTLSLMNADDSARDVSHTDWVTAAMSG
jgi:hypothetical protein